MTGFPRPPTDLSEVFYNGFRFPPALSSSIRSSPVYDDSRRQVIYVNHTITIEFILHNGVDEPYREANIYQPVFPATDWSASTGVITDESLKVFREMVTAPGGHLVVNNIGFGGTRTNPALNVISDVNYGPKPRIVEWKDIAGGRAIRVRWQCDIALSETFCGETIGNVILVHNATQEWDISRSGITTRTTTGHIVIRANTLKTPSKVGAKTNAITGEIQDTGTNQTNIRASQIRVLQTADAFRSRINYPPIAGFERTQSFNLSTDKTRLDYQLVDTEIESQNPYFPGTVSIEGSQRTSTDNFAAGINWLTTISATVRLARNRNFYWAWLAFARIVEKRLRGIDEKARMWKAGGGVSGSYQPRNLTQGQKTNAAVIGRKFSFEEQLFEPTFRFAITFQVVCDRDFIFVAMSAGEPVYGQNETWRAWLNELRQVHNLRGLTGMIFDPRTDTLFGLCDPSSEFQEQLLLTNPQTPGVPDSQKKPPPTYKKDESKTWLYYKTETKIIEDTQRIPHYKLEPNEYQTSDNTYDTPASPDPDGKQSAYTLTKRQDGGSAPIIQARSTTKYLVEVTGAAERVGYGIGTPVMLSYAGVECFPVGDRIFETSERRDPVNNDIITRAFWKQMYQLARKPDGEPATGNNTTHVNWG